MSAARGSIRRSGGARLPRPVILREAGKSRGTGTVDPEKAGVFTAPGSTPPSDMDLVSLAKTGDNAAFESMLSRYRWLVRAKARAFFLQGAEYDDLIQEGMIGLFKAVRDFRQNGSSFQAFADLCITRQIITAVKTATRQKHVPLNSALSFETPRYGADGERTLGDGVRDDRAAFDVALLKTAEVRTILATLRKHLSIFEYSALILWLEGHSYEGIAHRLGKRMKSVDNGLWRVKCKIRRLVDRDAIFGNGS